MPKPEHPLESSFSRLEKFRLYETSTTFYLIGFDHLETMFRLLKINRLILKPKSLAEIVREDDMVYSPSDIAEILKMVDEGNKASGGLVKVCEAYGVVGFVKFLDCYYFTLITQRREVGCIAGNFIYSIKATEMFPIRPRDDTHSNALTSIWRKLNKKLSQSSSEVAESRYMGLFQFVDMTKDFFFSYTYDLTNSLQHNYLRAATARLHRQEQKQKGLRPDLNMIPTTPQDMYQWNHYQVHAFQELLSPSGSGHWVMPLIYGSFQQKRFSLFGKYLDLIMIARRSRHYAGTRYLKRGISVHGKAANDCEIEQIVQHDDSYRSHFCSHLQMRGSIPTYWYQETSVTMPKPPILINRVDPDYRASEEHFTDMFRRYSAPIIALDLVKQHEKRARESLVGKEFRQAVEVVNESISLENKIRYIALDYSRITSISKGKNKGAAGKDGGTAAGNGVGQEWKNLVENASSNAASPVEGGVAAGGKANGHVGGTADGNAAERARTQSVNPLDRAANDSPTFGNGAAGGLDGGDDMDPLMLPLPPGAKGAGKTSGTATPQGQQEIKIDVLRELEDVASMSIGETGFFCNTTDFLTRVKQLPPSKVEKGNKLGHLEQRGVLRTNCIDCLDRTNGAQFAVAMKFLNVSLHAMGICSETQGLEPSSQILVSLMEMYGEMGDKIALQYGGSEAHRKVPGGQALSSIKQSELLTSIKRYYSNAFTDMMKQDAMNVFLGCFQPTEAGTPLWDLDSDWDLHNSMLRPPSPRVNPVLFSHLYLDSHALTVLPIRQLIEGAIKKALTDLQKSSVSLVPVHSKKKLRKVLQREGGTPGGLDGEDEEGAVEADLTIRTDKLDDVVEYLKKLDIPNIDRARLLRLYFIRCVANSPNIHSAASSVGLGLDELASSQSAAGTPGAPPALFTDKLQLKIAVRNIGRLEKRKFLRSVASKKVSKVADSWWRDALAEYETNLYGMVTPVVETDRATLHNSRRAAYKPANYFQRVYTPHVLSEFDALLALEFFAPVEAMMDIKEIAPRPPPVEITVKPKPTLGSTALVASDWRNSVKQGHRFSASNSRLFEAVGAVISATHLAYLPTSSYIRQHISDEYPVVVAQPTATGSNIGSAFQAPKSTQKSTGNPNAQFQEPTDDKEAAAGFQLTRYMRKLVGGFLRKEDSGSAAVSTNKSAAKTRGGQQEWNWQHHMINYREHRVPRKSAQLYTRYVNIAQNNLILMEKMGNQRLAEEEYHILLRDLHIDVDNVTAMEHLAIEGYVSAEINQGVYQGMPQRESAILAHCWLQTSLAQVETEIQMAALHPLVDVVKDPFVTPGSSHSPSGPLTASNSNGSLSNLSSAASHPSALAATPGRPPLVPSTPGVASHSVSSPAPKAKRDSAFTATSGKHGARQLPNLPAHPISSSAVGQDPRQLVRQTLQKSPGLEGHMQRCIERVDRVRGLEREFRRQVGDYIVQQAAYSKEHSHDFLSTRLSSITSENTIVEYSMLFDPIAVAKDLDEEVSYMASCGPASQYEGYTELLHLQQTLAPTTAQLRDRKNALLAEATALASKNGSPPVDQPTKGGAKTASAAPTAAVATTSTSISAQLGLDTNIPSLQKDLQTDYSLPSALPFPYVKNVSLPGLSEQQSEVFFQLESDVYVRSTNPFMQLNEVAVNSLYKSLYAF